MQKLRDVFGVFAGKNFIPAPAILSDEYQRPIFKSPPVPTGEWSLIVDENGDRVTTRQPLSSDMLARPPVHYNYGGTLPKFEAPKGGDRIRNLPGLIDYETRAQINKEYLDKAVFLLSQTDDGRRLLEKAWTNKFTFAFDAEGTTREGAVGLCDFEKKMIPLAEGRSPSDVALTLKHELQHMEDMMKGAGYTAWSTPQTARLMDRAMEGNARVSESVAAAEALMGSPKGPEQQFRTPALFRNFWNKQQPMARAAFDVLPLAKQGKWKEFASKVFPAYFKDVRTLDLYDMRYAEFLKREIPDIASDQAKAEKGQYHEREDAKRRIAQATANAQPLFTVHKSATEVAQIIMQGGLPYLDKSALEAPEMQQMSTPSLGVLAHVKEKLEKILPSADKSKLLTGPARDAVQPPAQSNPYKAFPSEIAGPDTLQPIILPNRLDGPSGATNFTRYADVTNFMTDAMQKMRSGRTETDKLNYCISQYMQYRGSTANPRGIVGDLLDAGLRAPVGAFPQEYLSDLYRRMYSAAEVGSTGERSPLSSGELKLIRHWQDMKDSGLDPTWINAENKAQSQVSTDREIVTYAGFLVKGLKQPESAGAGPVQARKIQ